MPKLEELLQNLHDVHGDFRLWFTSMPSPHFPVSILQNGVKVTTEAPQGLKATLRELFSGYGQKILKECPKEAEFKSIFYSLCFFHAVVLGRRKYGPLGWNCLYEWTKGDLDISRKQLNLLLSTGDTTPFRTLGFLAGASPTAGAAGHCSRSVKTSTARLSSSLATKSRRRRRTSPSTSRQSRVTRSATAPSSPACTRTLISTSSSSRRSLSSAIFSRRAPAAAPRSCRRLTGSSGRYCRRST
jgi:hypothetical protein